MEQIGVPMDPRYTKYFYKRRFKQEMPKNLMKQIKADNFFTMTMPLKNSDLQQTLMFKSAKYSSLDFNWKLSELGGGSDHRSFINKGVPYFYIFGGFGKNMHTPKDSIRHIDFNFIEKITKFAFIFTFNYANQ